MQKLGNCTSCALCITPGTSFVVCFKLRARFLQNGGGLHVERLAMSDGSLLSENVAEEVRRHGAACSLHPRRLAWQLNFPIDRRTGEASMARSAALSKSPAPSCATMLRVWPVVRFVPLGTRPWRGPSPRTIGLRCACLYVVSCTCKIACPRNSTQVHLL